MNPAFIMAMSAAGASQPRRKTVTRTSTPSRTTSRKRVRVSHLTRKYRSNARSKDEAVLVGDTPPPAYPGDSDAKKSDGTQQPARSPTTRKPRSQRIAATSVMASARVAAAAPAVASQTTAYQTPVRFSRFPGSWPEAISQVSSAVSSAVMEGHDRVRVDVKTPELIADFMDRGAVYQCEKTRHARRIALLAESANSILGEIFNPTAGAQNPYNFLFTPTRAAIFFNSEEDQKNGEQYMDPSISSIVDTYVLGRDTPSKVKANVSIVIAPCNKQGNPEHIEAVELVHYSNWNNQKLVIMLNPDLFALTRYTSLDDEPRQPCFLSDYVPSYYIDPAAFPSTTATGAVLRCFPRKWEMYLLKMQNDMGFRLVAEQMTPPSAEKIRCEFSSRIERELETGFAI